MSARLALYLQPDMWELSLKAVYHSLRCSIATLSSIFCSGAFIKKQGGAFAEGQGQVHGRLVSTYNASSDRQPWKPPTRQPLSGCKGQLSCWGARTSKDRRGPVLWAVGSWETFNKWLLGIFFWWSSGKDSMLPRQGAWVQSLVA